MKTELYRKVEIKSENDLPKIKDDYFVHVKNGWSKDTYVSWESKNDNEYWLYSFDWYLQPLPDETKVKDEEVCNCDGEFDVEVLTLEPPVAKCTNCGKLISDETKRRLNKDYHELDDMFKGLEDEEPEMRGFWIILHQGKPLNDFLFTSDLEARNYVKMTYPKRRFIEPKDNIFIDKNYGAKFEIINLKSR
jgi:hypothetical protein